MASLVAQIREITGKKTKNVRIAGLVPAAAYGPKQSSETIQFDSKEFIRVYKDVGHSKLVDIELNGKLIKGLIKEVQIHPVTRKLVHVSLYVVDMETEIEAEVPLEITGLAPAVKNNLGFLEVPANSVTIRCLPGKLPAKFEINIDKLAQVGDAITVSDLHLEEGVTVMMDDPAKTKLAFIAPPQKIEEEKQTVAAEGEVAAEGAEGATSGDAASTTAAE